MISELAILAFLHTALSCFTDYSKVRLIGFAELIRASLAYGD
jgi:hypothetical protein